MADAPKDDPKPAPAPTLDALLKQFSKITEYQARKAFFRKHPLLATVINPNNFSA